MTGGRGGEINWEVGMDIYTLLYIRGARQATVHGLANSRTQLSDFTYLLKINVGGDLSHEIKRHLLLGRKAMTNIDSMLKSRDILPTKVCIVKAMVFPVVMYGCEELNHKQG